MTASPGTRRRAAAVALAMLASVIGVLAPGPMRPAAVRAAEYTLTSQAHYAVLPEERRVEVEVGVTFENTTPNPPGQFSVFEVVDLAVQVQAQDVTATDDTGELNVSVGTRDGTRVVTVRPRSDVRYQEETTFTLRYVLPDAGSGGLRVRPSVVIFPAWGFGTASRVTVSLPSVFEVAVDGDELTASRNGTAWQLDSGHINDPTRWLAVVTATRPTSFVTLSEGVPLSSGTVDLQLRAWEDDRAWGERSLALLVRALPLLEEQIGLEYPQVGPLVVVESVTAPDAGLGEPEPGEAEIAAAFSEPPFTLVHQAAHIWFRAELAGDRWIREGFASQAAAAIAERLDVEPPFEPAAMTDELGDDAFPLVSWGAGEATIAQDRYAYAASWLAADRITGLVGDDALRAAWQRIAAGIGAYDPVSSTPAGPGDEAVTPVGSRELLDQLQATTGAEVEPVFTELVLDEATAALLAPRADARVAFAQLLAAAGDWGAPDPIRSAMGGWSFGQATEQIDEAMTWLGDRDVLLADAARAGLLVPQRLRDRYVTGGGGADARAELDAEAAVVDGYLAVHERLGQDRSIFERVGLLGGPDPSTMLADAGTLFAEGDLRGAAEAVEASRARLDSAALDGVVRMVSVAALVLLLVALAVWLLRRRSRAGSDYTAAP
jgi:hypothetical protein